jgi:hypothetical protein
MQIILIVTFVFVSSLSIYPHSLSYFNELAARLPTQENKNDPQLGRYALSVNYIYNREKQYRYFLYFESVATAGYSIYIYHRTQDDVNKLHQRQP